MPNRWNDNAILRRNQIESGLDLTFSKVFVPYFVEAVRGLKPKRILELGGGTGHLAKELYSLVEEYVMLEPSPGMYAVATETLHDTRVRLHSCAAEDLPFQDAYDFVISHLCIQVIGDPRPFFRSISEHLSPRGRFAVTLPHPAFYNDYKGFFPRDDFEYMKEMETTVSFSITLDPLRRIEGVPYHHRPLMRYINDMGHAGLCLTQMDEIFPDSEVQALYGESWDSPRYVSLVGKRCDLG